MVKRPTIEDMITVKRATVVALELFPDDYHDGVDCRNQWDKPGQPCDICAGRKENWANRIIEVRKAMMKAFGHTSKE